MLNFENIGFALCVCIVACIICSSNSVEPLPPGTQGTNQFKALSHSSTATTSCNGTEDNQCGTIEFLGCTGNKKFYHESAIKMNWFEAWEYCRSVGLHLASIESRHEQIFVELFLPPLGEATRESFWTSGTDLGKEGQFSWMSNGRDLSFTNYRPGEPNNQYGSEHCLVMVIRPGVIGFQWNDINCHAKAYTLCQEDTRFPEKYQEAGNQI